MQMSLKGDPAPGDSARALNPRRRGCGASATATSTRGATATAFPYRSRGLEIHYTNYRYRSKEQKQVDYSRPGSILYKRGGRTESGRVMYTAPVDASPRSSIDCSAERRNLASPRGLLRRPEESLDE